MGAGQSALAAGENVMGVAKAAAGLFDETAKKNAAKACDAAQDAVESA